MAEGRAEISVAASPDDAWKLLREFGSLEQWMPGIESCKVDGDVRALGMMGIEIKEQLRTRDDDTRTIAYSLIESPMKNLESHLATIHVEPEGSGSHITWDVAVSPDEMLAMFQPVYEGSLVEVKKKLEA